MADAVDGRPLQDRQQLLLNQSPHLRGVGNLVAVYLLPHRFQDFGTGRHTQVGSNQGDFKLLQQFRINFLVATKDLVEPARQVFLGGADGLLQALEDTRGRRRPEQRLDWHTKPG